MIRKEFSFFLKNAPGELGKLASLLKTESISIEAITIQDASNYVKELLNARGKSLKRIASTTSYDSMRRDSDEFALVRMVVNQPDRTAELLTQNNYIFEITPVFGLRVNNEPGNLAEIASKLGERGLNINYIYCTASTADQKCLVILSPEDFDQVGKTFESFKN